MKAGLCKSVPSQSRQSSGHNGAKTNTLQNNRRDPSVSTDHNPIYAKQLRERRAASASKCFQAGIVHGAKAKTCLLTVHARLKLFKKKAPDWKPSLKVKAYSTDILHHPLHAQTAPSKPSVI